MDGALIAGNPEKWKALRGMHDESEALVIP
jgi:hypothetical protein